MNRDSDILIQQFAEEVQRAFPGVILKESHPSFDDPEMTVVDFGLPFNDDRQLDFVHETSKISARYYENHNIDIIASGSAPKSKTV